ncbi:MAG: hypothetical protein J7M03_05980 [Candidatus Desulfofervidaceae bacterium]|nr:hypothetical protein [Candidatus Desulfofervidaceae bacterium]MDL1969977.1 hypothetical protein [Candidatus Desulfofervidaceae bacterium]
MNTDKIVKIFNMAVNFYHNLLYKNRPQYSSQWETLAKWKIEQPEIKNFKIGYCPETNAFAKYYAEVWEKYPVLKNVCLSLGLLSESPSGLKDALDGSFLFPCLDEKGTLLDVAIYHPQKGWRFLYPNDTLGTFGLWQVNYCLTDYEMVFLLPDIPSFFAFNRLLFPTGVNPSLACLKGLNPELWQKLEDLGVGQAIVIAQEVPASLDTYIDIVTIPDKGSAIANLKAALPQLQHQRFRRLIEVGLEVMEKIKEEGRGICDSYYLTR